MNAMAKLVHLGSSWGGIIKTIQLVNLLQYGIQTPLTMVEAGNNILLQMNMNYMEVKMEIGIIKELIIKG